MNRLSPRVRSIIMHALYDNLDAQIHHGLEDVLKINCFALADYVAEQLELEMKRLGVFQ